MMDIRCLHNAYEDLYRNVSQNYSPRKRVPLSTLFPQVGSDYSLGNPIRFMLVGRALNGWRPDEYPNASAYADAACKEIAPSQGLNDFFHAYNTNLSSFWRTSRRVLQEIYKYVNVEQATEWQNRIIWMNLFPIAPQAGGNPSSKLIAAQRNEAKIILEYMIQEYRPTHILFVTGLEGWIVDESEPMIDLSSMKASQGGYVCRFGRIHGSKVVITNRPDSRRKGKKEVDYIAEVASVFNCDF